MAVRKKVKAPKARGDAAKNLLGDVLIEKGLVTADQLEKALALQAESGKRIGGLLVDLGALDERTLVGVLAWHLGVELVDLGTEAPSEVALTKVPEELARKLNAVPVRMQGDELVVAVADPTDFSVREELQATAGVQIRPVIGLSSDIASAIDSAYRAMGAIEHQVRAFESAERARRVQVTASELASDAAPVVRIVNLLIAQGLRDRASDVHVEPQEGCLRIRYRIDGALSDVLSLPETMAAPAVSRLKIMAGMNIVERQRPQDGQIETQVDGKALDIRVSTTPTIWGEKAVLRLLDKSKQLFSLEDVGFPENQLKDYRAMVHSPVGMVAIAGPTGSGKTTTLYATLGEINNPEKNIMTVEDPVEYIFPSINQIQIREQAGVTFEHGLKSILRQDPDVILVGEIRNVETARIAVQSSLTGHLVLSSIHAIDSVSALHRFLDMEIEPFLVASAITGVVAQRLVRKICTHCRTPYVPADEEKAFFKSSGGDPKTKFTRGEGCNFCSRTGYRERTGVFEVLRLTDEMRQLVVRHATTERLAAQAVKQGMQPLRKQAIRLVEEGTTTIAEVLRTIYI